MNRAKGCSAAATVLALFMSCSAAAAPTVLDFESLRRNDNDIPTHGVTYVEDGYVLHILTARAGWATIGVQHGGYKGSTAIFPNTWRSDAILARLGGGTFDLLSVDLIEHIDHIEPTVTFRGITNRGTQVSTTFQLDGNTQLFETFHFPETFTDLTQVTWSHFDSENSFRLDNITLDLPAPPAVPLPPAALAALGMLPLLARIRRRFAHRKP